MPDWTYHPLFKPALSKLPARRGRAFIHQSMNRIAKIPAGSRLIEYLGHTAPAAELETNLFGVNLSNPVGLSGKIDPHLLGTDAFSFLGMGFIEIGPVALEERKSAAPEFTAAKENLQFPHLPESLGLYKTIEKIEKLKPSKKPLLLRLDKSASVKETLHMAQTLSRHAAALIIEKQLSINDWQQLKASANVPLLIACRLEKLDIIWIEQLATAGLIEGVVIEEAGTDTVEGIVYPLSQPKELTEKVIEIKTKTAVPVIASGGIADPADALALFHAGADAVMLSGGYVFTGPGLPKRINEALLDDRSEQPAIYKGWIWHWLFGLLMVIGGLVAMLVSLTTVILPYDEAFLGLTRAELLAINPNIYHFMQHDRMTVAGAMVSGGILYMQLARYGVRHGLEWAKRSIHIAGTVGFLGILLFIGFGYFDWLHGLLWLVLLPFFLKGYFAAKSHIGHSRSVNRINNRAWKKSLWGQLVFVSLGFGLTTAGLVISFIGVNGVFVKTDLAFICMSPEQLTAINDRLIPVIAHDRAGLGSALVSVGLLVLMVALWGFQEGQRWVWFTLLFGGIPAFGAAIAIHFVIGYTSFIHLAPAYLALLLFAAGLWGAREFLLSKPKPIN